MKSRFLFYIIRRRNQNESTSFGGKHVCAKPKELQYGDTVSLPAPAPAYTPEQQRRRNGLRCAALFLRLRTAPRTGLRPRAGWLRLRAGAPTRRAAFGSRAARAAGGRLRAGSAIRNIERIPQDRRTVGRRASAAGPAVVAVSIKSRTESEQNTASLWSDAKTSDTGRTTPSCPLAFRQGWTQRPAALNCRKAASANKRTCLGGSSGN